MIVFKLLEVSLRKQCSAQNHPMSLNDIYK